jgi:hypothetical protein
MQSSTSATRWSTVRVTVALAMAGAPAIAGALPAQVIAHPAGPAAQMTTVQLGFMQRLEHDPAAAHVEAVAIDQIGDPADVTVFEIEVPTVGTVRLQRFEWRVNEGGLLIWRGRDADPPADGLLVARGSDVVGTIRCPGTLATIRPLGKGLHVVVVWDMDALSVCEVGVEDPTASVPNPPASLVPPPTPCPPYQASTTPCTEIWIVAGYTEDAAQNAGVPAGSIEQVIVEAVEVSNIAYANSEIDLKLVIRKMFPVAGFRECCLDSTDACGSVKTDSENLRAPVPELQIVHDMRNLHAADVAVLFTDYAKCGGYSPIPDCPYDSTNEVNAFSVVRQKVSAGQFLVGHEIGHLHGAWHNQKAIGSWVTRTPALPYSHGYCYEQGSPLHPEGWNTVMAYHNDWQQTVICKDYVAQYSNPDVIYPLTPTPGGAATGDVSTHDVARVLEETACTVAGFRVPATVSLDPATAVIKKGETLQIEAGVERDGSPLVGERITFISLDPSTVTVAPPQTTTGLTGKAVAVVEGVSSGDAFVRALSHGGVAKTGIEVAKWWWEKYLAIAIIVAIALYLWYRRRERANR